MAKKNLILAFESSCDETSVAVIEDGQKIFNRIDHKITFGSIHGYFSFQTVKLRH